MPTIIVHTEAGKGYDATELKKHWFASRKKGVYGCYRMNNPLLPRWHAWALYCLTFLAASAMAKDTPLALYPQNPHYFLFRGKPEILITSGEHYGAVINLDFNQEKYLDTLYSNRLNLTRTFTGAYVEPQGAFDISDNTLAPAPERFICPWARSTTPYYANRGNKFDLTRFDPAYFKRLKSFLQLASKRGIVVEMNLFCPFYEESQWNLSPMNHLNNVNNLGTIERTNVYTLDKHGGLLAVQEAMVRKIVEELRDFDNLYYEVCNEPYFGGVTLEWQHHIAEVIQQAEAKLKRKHLISRNVANDKAKVVDPHEAFSIFNFHYATPPDTVHMNYLLKKVIGDNETGFKGQLDATYRIEGWEFIMAGGGLYNNLDYSFTVGHEDGTYKYPIKQPGGGSPALRQQLQYLSQFMHSLPFTRMTPDNFIIKGGTQTGAVARALVEKGNAYAIYIRGGRHADLKVDLSAGSYKAEWFNPRTGKVDKSAALKHSGGIAVLPSPDYEEDIALRILKSK